MEAIEKGQGLGGVFEVAQRLGLESEMEVFTGLEGEAFDPESERIEVSENEIFVGFEFLEGAGEGGDGAAAVFGAEAGDDGEELLGVDEAGERGPVGLIDVFFDAGAVEGSVGEAVDGEDVAVFRLEPVFEVIEGGAFEKVEGGLGGETQADGEFFSVGDLVADGEDVGFEDLKSFGPSFGGVDISAVGEVLLIAEGHNLKGEIRALTEKLLWIVEDDFFDDLGAVLALFHFEGAFHDREGIGNAPIAR